MRAREHIEIARQRRRGLARFHEAQEKMLVHAMDELVDGRKRTHWMWFVFPQAKGLSKSVNGRVYALSKREARRYIQDEKLEYGLGYGIGLVRSWLVEGRPLEAIFGPIDAQKFKSSMELFASVGYGPAVEMAPLCALTPREIMAAENLGRNLRVGGV